MKFLIIFGKNELIEEFKEKLEIYRKQTGESPLKITKEINLKKLKNQWTKRIQNTDGIIYSYKQKELIDSFIKDLS